MNDDRRPELLIGYLEDVLDEEERAEAEALLAQDPEAQAMLEAYQDAAAALGALPLPEPPPAASEAAYAAVLAAMSADAPAEDQDSVGASRASEPAQPEGERARGQLIVFARWFVAAACLLIVATLAFDDGGSDPSRMARRAEPQDSARRESELEVPSAAEDDLAAQLAPPTPAAPPSADPADRGALEGGERSPRDEQANSLAQREELAAELPLRKAREELARQRAEDADAFSRAQGLEGRDDAPASSAAPAPQPPRRFQPRPRGAAGAPQAEPRDMADAAEPPQADAPPAEQQGAGAAEPPRGPSELEERSEGRAASATWVVASAGGERVYAFERGRLVLRPHSEEGFARGRAGSAKKARGRQAKRLSQDEGERPEAEAQTAEGAKREALADGIAPRARRARPPRAEEDAEKAPEAESALRPPGRAVDLRDPETRRDVLAIVALELAGPSKPEPTSTARLRSEPAGGRGAGPRESGPQKSGPRESGPRESGIERSLRLARARRLLRLLDPSLKRDATLEDLRQALRSLERR